MIFITGCARSGTSLTAGVIKECGAKMGRLNGLNENLHLREHVVKPYLRRLGVDPLGQYPLPDPLGEFPAFPELTRGVDTQIGAFLPDLSAQAGRRAYKCAKACLIYPAFVEQYPKAKWVIVRRDTDRIIDSCLRTRFMRAYDTREGWREWVTFHIDRFNELCNSQDIDTFEVWPEKAVKGDLGELREMIDFCGLEWTEPDTINPKQYSC